MLTQPKKMFKILCSQQKAPNGPKYWTNCGVGFENRDASITVRLDYLPKDWSFLVRQFDEDETRRMNERREQRNGGTNPSQLNAPGARSDEMSSNGSSFNAMSMEPTSPRSLEDVPF